MELDRDFSEFIASCARHDVRFLDEADFLEEGTVVQLGYPPTRIDILTSADGVDFDSCWERRVEIPVGGQVVPFISLDDLIANKDTSGRPQDVADAAVLKERAE